MTPIPCVWTGRAFEPINARFVSMADDQFGQGEVVNLAAVEDRSSASHRHYFALINEAWQNLPEHLGADYPNPEALRKRALIKAGFCTVADYVCATRAEAERWAGNLRREADDYALVIVSEAVVRVYRAQSQSMRAMGRERFQASKDAVLHVLSELIGSDVADLRRAANDNPNGQGRAAA